MQLQCVRCGFRGDVNITRTWGAPSWIALIVANIVGFVISMVVGVIGATVATPVGGDPQTASNLFFLGSIVVCMIISGAVAHSYRLTLGKCRNCNFDFGKL